MLHNYAITLPNVRMVMTRVRFVVAMIVAYKMVDVRIDVIDRLWVLFVFVLLAIRLQMRQITRSAKM